MNSNTDNSNNFNHNGRNDRNSHDDIDLSQAIEKIKEESRKFCKQWNEYVANHLPPPNKNFPKPPYDDNWSIQRTDSSLSPYDECNKCNEKHKHNIRLSSEIEKLKKENQKLKLENSKLRICVRGICQMIRNDDEPYYESVKMAKLTEDIHCSLEIDRIKKQTAALFRNKLEIDLQPHIQFKENIWIDDKALENQIRNHIQINGVNYIKTKDNHQMIIKKKHHNHKRKRNNNYNNRNNYNHNHNHNDNHNRNNYVTPGNLVSDAKYEEMLKLSECTSMSAKDMIECYHIQEHRVSALIGQVGVRAKRDIPRGTVLGQYTGTEYLDEEFDKIFQHTNHYDLRNIYAFDCPLLQIGTSNDGDGDSKMDDDYQDGTNKKMIIDGYAHLKKNYLVYINDCRKNIKGTEPTDDDDKYWNCSFRTVFINGYPAVFVIAKKDICAGQDLHVFYGANYGNSLRNVEHQKVMKSRMLSLMDNSILRILGWKDGQTRNDVYVLE